MLVGILVFLFVYHKNLYLASYTVYWIQHSLSIESDKSYISKYMKQSTFLLFNNFTFNDAIHMYQALANFAKMRMGNNT